MLQIFERCLYEADGESVVIPNELDQFIDSTIVPFAGAHWFTDTRTCLQFVLRTFTDGDTLMQLKDSKAYEHGPQLAQIGLALAHRIMLILTKSSSSSVGASDTRILCEDDSRELFSPSIQTPFMRMRSVSALLLWLYFFSVY